MKKFLSMAVVFGLLFTMNCKEEEEDNSALLLLAQAVGSTANTYYIGTLTTTTVEEGSSYTFAFTINGTNAETLDVYFSTDNAITTLDTRLSTINVTGLATTQSVTVTAPAAGIYYVGLLNAASTEVAVSVNTVTSVTAVPVCRNYATNYTGDDGTKQSTNLCTFDEALLTLTCDFSDTLGNIWTTVSTYSSVQAFVDEAARPYNFSLFDTATMTGTAGDGTTTNTFSGSNLVGSVSNTLIGADTMDITDTFYSWDGNGRPTYGLHDSVYVLTGVGTFDCIGKQVSLAYDDVALTLTYDTLGNGIGSSCFTTPTTTIKTFDADMNLVSIDHSVAGVTNYTTNATAQVCY